MNRSQTSRRVSAATIVVSVLFAWPCLAADPLFDRVMVFEQGGDANYHIPSMVVAKDGTILAFCEERWQSARDDVAECHVVLRRSKDNGKTWLPMQTLRREDGKKWHIGSAIVDDSTGTVFLMCGGGWLQSSDNGATWEPWTPEIVRAEDGIGAGTHGSAAGITLQYGPHKGRLLWPARGTDRSDGGYDDGNHDDRRAKCYTTALYSDDHGQTLHRANLFLRGTGESCLVERMNGDIYTNARAYFDDNRRRTAISHDGGASFADEGVDQVIREVKQGCNASIVRFPASLVGGRDVVLFANPDAVERTREQGVVRLSLDGAKTWAYSKDVCGVGDWFDYSSLAVAQDGTILVMYKTSLGAKGAPGFGDSVSMAVARFNLEWVTDGAMGLGDGQ